MAELSAERKTTAKLVMRHLMKPETRKYLKTHGFGPQTPVVACEWESSVGEVLEMLRMQDGSKHVILLIRKGQEMKMLFATGGSVPAGSASVRDFEMHVKSTMGMVFDALSGVQFTIDDPRFGSRPSPRIGQYDLEPASV